MARIAILQMTAGIDPRDNARILAEAVREAGQGGADMLFTPEMSGLLDRDRKRAAPRIVSEEEDAVLATASEAAAKHGLWLSIGSLAVRGCEDKWANRAFTIGPDGVIRGRYDKMHMFDVDLASGESWRESNAYKAGEKVVTVDATPVGKLGLAICYDMRFPALFGALGDLRCHTIAVPAAFTVPTGRAHWHVLLRARAIEASAFIVAAAQVGDHADGRSTYGHSLVIDPWGEVLLDMGGDGTGVGFCDIDLARVAEVRAQVPSLANRRPIAK